MYKNKLQWVKNNKRDEKITNKQRRFDLNTYIRVLSYTMYLYKYFYKQCYV